MGYNNNIISWRPHNPHSKIWGLWPTQVPQDRCQNCLSWSNLGCHPCDQCFTHQPICRRNDSVACNGAAKGENRWRFW